MSLDSVTGVGPCNALKAKEAKGNEKVATFAIFRVFCTFLSLNYFAHRNPFFYLCILSFHPRSKPADLRLGQHLATFAAAASAAFRLRHRRKDGGSASPRLRPPRPTRLAHVYFTVYAGLKSTGMYHRNKYIRDTNQQALQCSAGADAQTGAELN